MRLRLRNVWAIWVRSCALVLALNALSTVGRAEDNAAEPAQYRAVVDEALREYAAKNYEEARSLFHRANELFPNARTHRGLGLAQFELRNYGECIRELEAALMSTVRPLPDAMREETQAVLARARNFVALITLLTTPPIAALRVDGVPVPRHEGQPLVLNVGDRELELAATGYTPEKRSLSVRGGERETIAVELVRAPELASVAVDPSPGEAAKNDRAARWYKSPWLWTGVALVVGAGVAGGVLLTREAGSAATYGGTADAVLGAL